MNRLPSPTEMQRAVRRRDSSYDGIFFLGVKTTGVFCRPSCPARRPLARNVEFFPGVREALFAGYRPCKRCRPLETDGRPPDWVRGLLACVDGDPAARLRDADLRRMGIEPARARRFFVRHYGMTFHAYARGRRMGNALESIRRGADLDDVALGYGYESHSGFREAFTKTFGRPPGKSRGRECVLAGWLETPLGPMIAAATSEGVCLLEFTDRRMLERQFRILRRLFRSAVVPGENRHLAKLREELGRYFEGRLRRFTVPLVYPGSPFQRKVWDALLGIPHGETRSYEAVAVEVAGRPSSCRAVAQANGSNRIAILIPCHRVVNKSGALGGYGGGLWRKRYLLDLELGRRPGNSAGPLFEGREG